MAQSPRERTVPESFEGEAKSIPFTDKTVKSLKPREKPYEVREAGETGLRIRVMPKTGTKTFRWPCRARNKVYTLGKYGDGTRGTLTLHAAHGKLLEYKAKHKAGVDPEGVATADRPKTVRQLCDRFYNDSIVARRKRPEVVADVIKREIDPTIGTLPLIAVDADACARVVRATVKRGSPGRAGKVLQVVKQLFRYAEANGFVQKNFAVSLSPDDLGVVANQRDRYLLAEEIPLLWKAIDDSNMEPAVKLGLRFLLFTGLRTNEALTLEWRDVSFEEKTVTVRVENQKVSPLRARKKNVQPWVQPLSQPALDILHTLRALAPKTTPWVFYSSASASKRVGDKALARAQRRLWRATESLKKRPEAVPHDYRKTLATHMSNTLRLAPHVGQICLGHSLNRLLGSGVADTYDISTRLDERRSALEKYATWIDGLVNGTSAEVIPIAR